MINFQELKKQCAECGKESTQDKWLKCQTCKIYKIFNTPCHFCSRIGGVVPFIKNTAKGMSQIDICPSCMEKVT